MLVRPAQRNRANLGTSRAVAGIISAATDAAMTTNLARRDRRVMAKPAAEATSTLNGTAIAATTSETTVARSSPPH